MSFRQPKIRILKEEAARHDGWVSGISAAAVILAAGDLCEVRVWDPEDTRHRWIAGRKAALLRRIKKEKLIPASTTK